MVLSEWNRSARSWAVNKLRVANKRASLHHRWTVAALLERWKMGGRSETWEPKGDVWTNRDKQTETETLSAVEFV